MSRLDFMKELESLLSDIPIEERNEALQYYNDYFEDAGPDHEDTILKELGSPTRIAGIIKADLSANATDRENRGVFTETGYQDTVYQDEKYEIINSAKTAKNQGDTQNSNSNTKEQNNTGTSYNQQKYDENRRKQQTNNTNLALILLLGVAILFGSPIIFGIFGVAIGLFAAVFALLFGFGIVGIAMTATGIGVFFAGLAQFGVPFIGLAYCGSGLLIFGIGILFILLSALIIKKLLPAMIKGIVSICRLPFKNRSVAA